MGNYLGEEIPKLGFGLMRLPMKDDAIDLEQTKDEILFEKGFYQDPSIYDSIDFEKELTVYQSSGRYDDIENQEEVEI